MKTTNNLNLPMHENNLHQVSFDTFSLYVFGPQAAEITQKLQRTVDTYDRYAEKFMVHCKRQRIRIHGTEDFAKKFKKYMIRMVRKHPRDKYVRALLFMLEKYEEYEKEEAV